MMRRHGLNGLMVLFFLKNNIRANCTYASTAVPPPPPPPIVVGKFEALNDETHKSSLRTTASHKTRTSGLFSNLDIFTSYERLVRT
ncbi:hypothetical protein BD289DRAFT_88677 [Coniella lustricola]|uniref:Secreted protein n=1 Tax=Coniella lustricola TaxID=2025994 RepID=A0A2T2ZYQ1_9PEZI|nr:hypothetical protein BD289DRAFT_88677 [Coniella lustricola]